MGKEADANKPPGKRFTTDNKNRNCYTVLIRLYKDSSKLGPNNTSIILCDWKVKVKKLKLSLCLNKHHAMKAYSGSGGIAPRILWPRH
jgi:hypothetical protein